MAEERAIAWRTMASTAEQRQAAQQARFHVVADGQAEDRQFKLILGQGDPSQFAAEDRRRLAGADPEDQADRVGVGGQARMDREGAKPPGGLDPGVESPPNWEAA